MGDFAELLAIKWLEARNFNILDKNYLTKEGEIDIMCTKNETIHFIEVKSSYSNYDAEQNLTKYKIKKIIRTANKYLLLKNIENKKINFDLISVHIQNQTPKITYYPNINIDLY